MLARNLASGISAEHAAISFTRSVPDTTLISAVVTPFAPLLRTM